MNPSPGCSSPLKPRARCTSPVEGFGLRAYAVSKSVRSFGAMLDMASTTSQLRMSCTRFLRGRKSHNPIQKGSFNLGLCFDLALISARSRDVDEPLYPVLVAQHIPGVAPAGQFAIEDENGELFGIMLRGNVFCSAPGIAVCG
jgi:hypothetical protein